MKKYQKAHALLKKNIKKLTGYRNAGKIYENFGQKEVNEFESFFSKEYGEYLFCNNFDTKEKQEIVKAFYFFKEFVLL